MSTTIIIIISVIVLGILKGLKPTKRRYNRKNNPYTPYKRFTTDNQINYTNNNYDLTRYEDQLKAVSSNEAKFTAQPLMRSGEFKVFKLIESQIMPLFKGCRLFAQVCLGEILNA